MSRAPLVERNRLLDDAAVRLHGARVALDDTIALVEVHGIILPEAPAVAAMVARRALLAYATAAVAVVGDDASVTEWERLERMRRGNE